MNLTAPPDLHHFSFSAFSILAASGTGNILLSPYSIASALALTLAGCTPLSPCQTEIENVLGISSHEEMATVRKELATLPSSSSEEEVTGVELVMANSIWTSSSIKADYINLVEQTHNALANPLPRSYQTIDDWISKNTNGLLKNVVSGDIDQSIVALLISVIRFKGIWELKFDVNKTKRGDFHLFGGAHNRSVDYMHAEEKMDVLSFVEGLGGASVVRLPYANNDFYALFVLPRENTPQSMYDAIQGLTNMDELFDDSTTFPRRAVSLTLPRFSVSYGTVSLKEMLQEMGMKTAFGGNSGENIFSAMSSDPSVYVDDVLHKVILEVNEEGTTAAAATIVSVGRSLPRPPVDMTFNRPFLMVVIGRGVPLFIGQIVDFGEV
eukprot:CAMPEP_0172489238 /NCGR_PEP_ID=MMETSP1066-20121228/19103_1 /TAXON_ID=671091 /ORGANISM="Coscinodiscus wailesii, Strain CCMP2513" /LENGTH=380 /DNA_ID=CAMNT_0013256949 /DNA_START=132 /DNA_END=1274 /DNA_ORIENTATION=+